MKLLHALLIDHDDSFTQNIRSWLSEKFDVTIVNHTQISDQHPQFGRPAAAHGRDSGGYGSERDFGTPRQQGGERDAVGDREPCHTENLEPDSTRPTGLWVGRVNNRYPDG